MKKAIIVASLALTALTGCMATPKTQAELEALPDSYFTNKTYYEKTTEERREWSRRMFAKERELDREAACVFGSRPAIDRSKLNCENVKGSPEYKKKYGIN